jgi:hypothetical protein
MGMGPGLVTWPLSTNFIYCQKRSVLSMTPQYPRLLPLYWKFKVSAWIDQGTPSFYYGGFVVGRLLARRFFWSKGRGRGALSSGSRAHHLSKVYSAS